MEPNISKQYFYQLKIRGSWGSWDVAHMGVVDASDKKKAKELIAEDLGELIAEKTSNKSKEQINFKVFLTELNDYWRDYWLNPKTCQICNSVYQIIHMKNSGIDSCPNYCSDKCRSNRTLKKELVRLEDYFKGHGKAIPVIYKITNKLNGKCYIGKTTQVFTLRWYQHFFQFTGTKFHKEIENSQPTDWIFEVIEIIKESSNEGLIAEREQFWINHFNSIENGYNTATAKKD